MSEVEIICEEIKDLLTESIRKLDEVSQRPARLLDEKEAGKYLGVSPGTLRKWRDFGRGPDFLQVDGNGKIIRYDIDDLNKYITAHPRRKECAA